MLCLMNSDAEQSYILQNYSEVPKIIMYRTYAKKPGFYSKSLFLTHKYLQETGFLSLPA